MGVALLSTDNIVFQLIVYLTKTQHVTAARINTSSIFTVNFKIIIFIIISFDEILASIK